MIRHDMQFKISVGGQVEDMSDLLRCEVICVLRCGLVAEEEVVKHLISRGGLKLLGLDNSVHFLITVRRLMTTTGLVTRNAELTIIGWREFYFLLKVRDTMVRMVP